MNLDNTAMFSDDQAKAEACFGAGLPPDAECELRLAGLSYHDGCVAEAHLHNALTLAPRHIAVHIGLYRYYFYKGRLHDALRCLGEAARRIGVSGDWRTVRAADAEFNSFDAILPRFYPFTLKAYGYLHLRVGNLDEGRAVTEKLLELDPQDKLGGKVLLNVLERAGMDEYDD